MTEKIEDQSFGESFESEGNEYEASNYGNSKIRYTRALLLEFNVCSKLPRDVDELILREFNGESDGTVENKSISDNSPGHCSLPRIKWNLDPAERWDNHLLMLDRESHLHSICSLEGRNEACQHLPLEGSYSAGVLDQKPPKSDFFQLSKSENPYRPPKKRLQPSVNISEPEKESLLGSVISADSITGNDKYGYDIPLDCSCNFEDSLEKNEENEVFDANETIEEIIEEVLEDNQPTFDDFWAEILETIHPFQQESSISPTNTQASCTDSELGIHIHNKFSPIPVDHLAAPQNYNFKHLENDDKHNLISMNPEAEFDLPDEDSLISIYDIIGPERSMTHGQLHPQIFCPEKTSLLHNHLNSPSMLMPNINQCYMTSYSVLQQPRIFPLMVDASCLNHPAKQVGAAPYWNAHEFPALPSEQATSNQGF